MHEKNQLKGSSFKSSQNPKKLAFLLHGYGDNSENFIPLAQYLSDSKTSINFFAPNAPSSIPQYPLGRQWFDLYPNGINFNEAGQKEKEILKQDCLLSLNLIKDYIDDLCSKYKLSYQDCFILGFSQGAMMAFELGKHINQIFAGCVLLSGRILPTKKYKKIPFIKTPIMILHGDQDTVLDPKYFKEACNILKNNDFIFESHLMKGEVHTVSPKTLQIVKNFIKKNL